MAACQKTARNANFLPNATTPDLARSENPLKAEVHGRVNSARYNHINRERINLSPSFVEMGLLLRQLYPLFHQDGALRRF